VGCSQALDEAADVPLPVADSHVQRSEIEIDHVGRIRLQDHLVLEVVLEPHRVLAVPSVERPDHRLEIGRPPRARPEAAQERRRVHRAGRELRV
jgi:hypothetical protein